MALRFSVCIPTYGKPDDILQVAINSAAAHLPAASELLILPDGPDAMAVATGTKVPREATVLSSNERLGLVANWNRCLSASHGELVHILHDDDAVAPNFYQAILSLARRYRTASMYATGFGPLGRVVPTWSSKDGDRAYLLVGEAAAAFLLTAGQHCCGSVVLSRRVVERQGLFREDYVYCPDEEAYLRYVTVGGLAFDPAALYRQRTHGKQARYATWRRADFVATYMNARMDGAQHFGTRMMKVAKDSTARRVISLALTLALAGDPIVAIHRLEDLAHCYRDCLSWPSFRLAMIACRFPGALMVAGLRRNLLNRAKRTW